jgi:hypothetical protein
MAAARRDVSIGFAGGQVLAVRVDEDALRGLTDALGGDGWHELAVEDGAVRVRLDKVVYVRVDAAEHRVGFG